MNTTASSSQKLAISNALSSVRTEKRLPLQMFIGDWVDYFFFEPYMMFDEGFVDITKVFLREEDATVVALINLGNDTSGNDLNPQAIFLEHDTGPMEYLSKLKGDGSPMNWLFLMDRYVGASDKGNWSIYCEKENDVAIFACRATLPKSTSSEVGSLLKAQSIMSLPNFGRNELFNFDKMVPIWKSTLIAEYALRRT
jgi:hypothetical protein